MKKILCLLAIAATIWCGAADKITVKNVQDLTAYGPNSFVYSLPRTRLKIDVYAIRNYTVPGPYCQYSEKLLNMKGSSSNPSEKWELAKVDVKVIEEPDPDYFYAVESKNSEQILKNVLGLNESGLILKVDDYNSFVQFMPEKSNYQNEVHFTDLSIYRNINGSSESDSKDKKHDFPTDTPTGKDKGKFKTMEQKAEEAANFIFKTRKRRFKLLSGQYDSFPDGAALAISVRELDRIEQEYVSLFIGKTYADTLLKSFYYVPKPTTDIDRFVITYLSSETGFDDKATGAGKTLVLELKNLQVTTSLSRLQMPKGGGSNCLLYRVPDKAIMHIYYGSIATVEGEIKVYQYGSMVPYCLNH